MKHVLFVLVTLFCLLMAGCAPREVRYVVGVSQCSDDEWREQMNKEIRREALFYPGVKIDIRTAKDNNAQQIADIESLIGEGVDLLIVSPNGNDAITPVIEKAYNKVFCFGRNEKTIPDKYTAYVGADNYKSASGRELYC